MFQKGVKKINTKVNVLMSTYNGADYLEEQIESILRQTGVCVQLYIRDDGSTDDTKYILRKYSHYKNISIVYGGNIGYAKSFLWLLQNNYIDTDYIAFSDQDDVWLEDKLHSAIMRLNRYNENELNLYYSSLIATNHKLEKLYKKDFLDRRISLGSVLSSSNVAGCSMVFNKSLADKIVNALTTFEINMGHDAWIYRSSIALDANIVYDENSYIMFRRHEKTASNLNKSLKEKMKNRLYHLKENPNFVEKTAHNILNAYGIDIPPHNLKLLHKITKYRASTKNYLTLLFSKELSTGKLRIDLYTRLLILLHLY